MRDGRLVQYATADKLLESPADEFVASFVGEDRGLKRLRVRTLHDVELDRPVGAAAGGPAVTRDTSLHHALSKMLADGTSRIDVVDGGGQPVGSVTLGAITRLIAPADDTGVAAKALAEDPQGT
jgi:osmoprotectant transport system ATP-binding protein